MPKTEFLAGAVLASLLFVIMLATITSEPILLSEIKTGENVCTNFGGLVKITGWYKLTGSIVATCENNVIEFHSKRAKHD